MQKVEDLPGLAELNQQLRGYLCGDRGTVPSLGLLRNLLNCPPAESPLLGLCQTQPNTLTVGRDLWTSALIARIIEANKSGASQTSELRLKAPILQEMQLQDPVPGQPLAQSLLHLLNHLLCAEPHAEPGIMAVVRETEQSRLIDLFCGVTAWKLEEAREYLRTADVGDP
jgi:hypothetical protein